MPKAKTKAAGEARRAPAKAAKEELLAYYREMLLIRRFEEKAGQMYGMGLIGGFLHLYIGQEAVVVGMAHAIGPDDSVITAYRCHAHALTRGAEPRVVMAELTGRAAGLCKGKGGSMHLVAAAKHFYGGHAIVGAPVPLGTGMAFAHKYRGDGRVCLTYFGDGAANQGQVFEAFNMAALWKLPVVFIIENNQYAMGTAVSRATAMPALFRRGDSFGISGRQVDGMDALAVRAAGEEAVARARAGEGPVLLEMLTYRYRGHSMSDPAKYRPKEEVSRVRAEKDPIEHVRRLLIEGGMADEAALKDVDREIRAVVAEAVEFAQNAPEPEAHELFTDVYREA